MKYLVSHKGQEIGPFELEEILTQLREKQLDLFDYVFDEASNDWILLMEHKEVSASLKSMKPQTPPKSMPVKEGSAPKAAKADNVAFLHPVNEWFLLKGEHRFGPFTYSDLVRMLQQKAAFTYDFVWHAGMSTWKRVAELEDFQPERIRSLFVQTGEKKNANPVFSSRQHPRQKFNGRVMIHDNTKLWHGEGFEISKGGAGVTMSNQMIFPGQQLNVHFKGHDGFPPFNALCEVVSKKFVDNGTPIEYGLKFLTLSQEAQDEFYKRVA